MWINAKGGQERSGGNCPVVRNQLKLGCVVTRGRCTVAHMSLTAHTSTHMLPCFEYWIGCIWVVTLIGDLEVGAWGTIVSCVCQHETLLYVPESI